MEAYKNLLKEEVEVLRAKGRAFVEGTLSRNDLKGFSGGLGSYSQKEVGKFMIRLRTPSGIVSREHFALILNYARQCGLEKVHLTTRQAVQIHDITIDQVCDIMKDAIDHDLFTRGGGGHFPRNVALSPMAGVDPEEAFDVTPFARQLGDYFLCNATTYKLPRKLKVAFSSGTSDTAGATVNDMGFVGVLDQGKPMFRMWLAGGMGSNPATGVPYNDLVDPSEVLYYAEAMVRLFMAEGDYENKRKARTRYIVKRMGEVAFVECYKKHLAAVREECHFEGIEPAAEGPVERVAETGSSLILPQRQEGRFSVVLHPLCGQLMLEDGEQIRKFIEDIPEADIRLSMDEELYVRNLTKEQAEDLLKSMEGHMMMTNVRMSVTCVGTPTCQTGVNQSQKLCREVMEAVKSVDMDENFLPKLYISGCPNCCARHAAAALGFSGRKISIDGDMKDVFDCYIGGKVGIDVTTLVNKSGAILAERIPAMIVELGMMLTNDKKHYEEALADGSAVALIEKYFVA